MAWEKRGDGQFYYRSLRVRGRVVKQYIGTGERGRKAAEEDRATRDARRQATLLRQEKNKDLDDLIVQLDEFGTLIDQLVTCQLLCAGWRKHHRQWRATNGRSDHRDS